MNDITSPVGAAPAVENLTPIQRAALEALVRRKRGESQAGQPAVPQIRVNPAARHEPFPLTDIQQAQWFGRSGLFDISVAGHGYVEFDCKGMDLDRLEAAFQIIIDRNPQMRIVVRPDLTQQVLSDLPPYRFTRHDLRGQPGEAVEAALAAVRDRMSHDIIPADTWPIFEVCATLWDDDELRLHFSFDLLVGDAWCFRMIIDEWARLYDDPANPRRAPAELTYRDYVLGFEEIEKSELFARSLEYWQRQLPDLAPAPQLPMVRQPADLDAIRARHHSIHLDGPQWQALKQRIRSHNLTPSAFFAAAFSEVMSLWNPTPRHTLNVTVFNRLPVHPEINDILVGEFNSFLLLDVDNRGGEGFAARAGRLQALLWSHLENRWVTGVRLMRELTRVHGVTTGEALMPVVFTSTIAHHEGEADIPTRYPGKWIYEVSQTPQVWMEHHLWEEGDRLSLHIDVVDGLFPEGLIEDFVATYEALLTSLRTDPAAWDKPNAAHLLPAAYAEAWRAYNQTAADRPSGLLHAGIAAAAAAHPDKVAVQSSRGSLTYGALDAVSNRLAHAVQQAGAKVNDLVALIAPKGWEQISGMLGITRAGAAYLPIEADTPAERVRTILADGEVSVVVTTADTLPSLPLPDGARAIIIDAQALEAHPPTPPACPATAGDIAYVIYTSGSTGKPKGVVISHAAALNTIVDINRRFAVTDKDVIFAISAMSFDLSVYDVFGGLAAGATLVMPSSQTPEPREWLDLCSRHGVTLWNSVPALVELFLTYAEDTGAVVPDSLRLVMMSGDWIPLGLPPMLETVRPDMEIVSLGGATEAAIWSIWHPIRGIAPEWKSIPYGRPLANQTMHVLNAWLQPCPPWVTGDIYIGGAGLAEGYFKDPEKTAASFIVHPRTGERLYRTGDLGRFHPDGYIEFLGRADSQVKLRGFRIELGEIEHAIAQTAGVAQAACVIVGDSNENRQLVAFVTTPAAVGDEEAFRAGVLAALAERLPDYMVPAQVKIIEDIPLSANGKVDRKRLSTLADVADTRTEYVAPRNDTEERVAAMCAEVLGVETVGVLDDFFALGGNSMIASRLIIRIQDVFEVELPFSKLFENPTVAGLSALVIEQVLAEIEAMEAS